jgi:hypothetical protein
MECLHLCAHLTGFTKTNRARRKGRKFTRALFLLEITRVDPKETCITLRPVPDALWIFFKKELNIRPLKF